ncbi:MAG: NBR1-Ig-like domain-containing protein [Acidobacteriota bacterium]
MVAADVWLADNLLRRLDLDLGIYATDDGPVLHTDFWVSTRPLVEVQAEIDEAEGWSTSPLSERLADALVDNGTGLEIAGAVVYTVEAVLDTSTFEYSALAFSLSALDGRRYLLLIDPVLTTFGLGSTLDELEAEFALAEEVWRRESSEKGDPNLVCVADEAPRYYHFLETIPLSTWVHNGIEEGGRLLQRDDTFHYITQSESSHGAANSPLFNKGTKSHWFKADPLLRCYCTALCNNTAVMLYNASGPWDSPHPVYLHKVSATVSVHEEMHQDPDGDEVWAHAVGAIGFKKCHFFEGLFYPISCRDGVDLNPTISLAGSKDGPLSGASVSIKPTAEAYPMSAFVSAACPPCERLLKAEGQVEGLDPGETIDLWIQWQRPNGGWVDPVLVKRITQNGASSDNAIAWWTEEHSIPQADHGRQNEFKIWARKPGTVNFEPACPERSIPYQRENIVLNLECTPNDPDPCAGAASATKSCSEETTAEASVEIHRFPAGDPFGSAQVILTETLPTGETKTHSVDIAAPGGTEAFADTLTIGSTWQFDVAPTMANTSCFALPPSYGTVEEPLSLRGSCITRDPNICEIFPPACQTQPPGTQCSTITTYTHLAIWKDWATGSYEVQLVPPVPGHIAGVSVTLPTEGGTLVEANWILSEEVCNLEDGFAKAAGTTTTSSGPDLYLRAPSSGRVVTGHLDLVGVARHDSLGVGTIQFYIDGELAVPLGFGYGHEDPWVCSERPAADCVAQSGWAAVLDSKQYSDGPHEVLVVATTAGGEQQSMHAVEVVFDNGGGDGSGGGGTGGDGDHAAFVDDAFPTQMIAGERRLVTLTAENTGTTTWTEEECYVLAMVGGSDPFLSGNQRIQLPNGPVSPGGTARFPITLTAPTTPDTYTTDWQMLAQVSCGGGGWFGPTFVREITVVPPPRLSVRFEGESMPPGSTAVYPDSAINEPGLSRVFELCNIGSTALALNNASDLLVSQPGDSAFFQMNIPPGSIPAGACRPVEISLSSTKVGEYRDTLRVSSNDPTSPYRVHLFGRRTIMVRPLLEVRDIAGIPIASSDVITFPAIDADAGVPTSRGFEICNTGADPLVVESPSSLVQGHGFTQIGDPPAAEVAPGDCSPFRVRFFVNQPGSYTGTVTIETNDSLHPGFSFGLTGSAN